MVKQIQTIRRQIADQLFECVGQFCGIGVSRSRVILVIKISISISYRTVPSPIWPIFSEVFVFADIFLNFLTSTQQNMRSKENIGNIVRNL